MVSIYLRRLKSYAFGFVLSLLLTAPSTGLRWFGEPEPTEDDLRNIQIGIYEWINRFAHPDLECQLPKTGIEVTYYKENADTKKAEQIYLPDANEVEEKSPNNKTAAPSKPTSNAKKKRPIHCLGAIPADEKEDVFYSQEVRKLNKDDFTMKFYQPFVFRRIWNVEEISVLQLQKSFEYSPKHTLKPFGPHAGRSGQRLYKTSDDQFVLKTVIKEEGETMAKIAKDYAAHISANRDSFLISYIGYFHFKKGNTVVRMIVMANLTANLSNVYLKYDIKGKSTRGFDPTIEQKGAKNPTYMEKGFKAHFPSGLVVLDRNEKQPGNTNSYVLGVLKWDFAWLYDQKALDYSILVIISEWEETTTRNSLHGTLRPEQKCTVPGVPNVFQIRIAIIDTLVLECFRKTIEDMAKSAVQILMFQDPNQVTIKPPDVYRDRIYKYAETEMFPHSTRRSTVS
ncbi:phosphatidylinositol-4-phosphate 5-Kinase domain-containing protein [Ditylenchus destructor]|nr:phosphatidylinositol-4-phosphate 5-Kinase domain-containing protein [Ditylenchus destructor]